ncbi:hypothetical protein D3C78_1908450 [compost metagenome]
MHNGLSGQLLELLPDFLRDHSVVDPGGEHFDEIVVGFTDLRGNDFFDLTDVFQLTGCIDDRINIEC